MIYSSQYNLWERRLMKDYSQEFRKAVEKAIKEHHDAGHPAYQCKEGYIVAIYPGGREVKLQKENHSKKLIKNV